MVLFHSKNNLDICTKNVQLLCTQFSNKIFGEMNESDIWQTSNNSLDFSHLFIYATEIIQIRCENIYFKN